MKPPEQAPLSTLRFTELIDGLLPPGVFNVATGGREAGQALTAHRDIAMLSVIGSVATGRAVMRAAADGIRPVLLELGGKNALIAFADADPFAVADAMIAGMNFAWCGQSCGSTSRAFIPAAAAEQRGQAGSLEKDFMNIDFPVNPPITSDLPGVALLGTSVPELKLKPHYVCPKEHEIVSS